MARGSQVREVYYPESDGKPMAESDDHREAMVRHIELLQDYYRGQNVYVSGDLLVYYVQGNPRKFIVPDAFVVKGIPPGKRRTYKIWVEGKSPDLVIETTSRKTRKKDMQKKPDLYEQLGIKEYFLFDPHQEYLVPQLQGYRLTPAGYRRIEAGTGGELSSVELGLRLSIKDGLLQFHRLDTGERLLSRAERAEWERAARLREADAWQREEEARLAAEAEVARLRAELARLRLPGT
jgi:Uma2 family endonuclease